MQLKDYLALLDLDQKRKFWSRVGHRLYISSIANGRRSPSPELAKKIEAETKGLVARWELRPDIWEPPKKRVRKKRTSAAATA